MVSLLILIKKQSREPTLQLFIVRPNIIIEQDFLPVSDIPLNTLIKIPSPLFILQIPSLHQRESLL